MGSAAGRTVIHEVIADSQPPGGDIEATRRSACTTPLPRSRSSTITGIRSDITTPDRMRQNVQPESASRANHRPLAEYRDWWS